jgi:hypothetical protein
MLQKRRNLSQTISPAEPEVIVGSLLTMQEDRVRLVEHHQLFQECLTSEHSVGAESCHCKEPGQSQVLTEVPPVPPQAPPVPTEEPPVPPKAPPVSTEADLVPAEADQGSAEEQLTAAEAELVPAETRLEATDAPLVPTTMRPVDTACKRAPLAVTEDSGLVLPSEQEAGATAVYAEAVRPVEGT